MSADEGSADFAANSPWPDPKSTATEHAHVQPAPDFPPAEPDAAAN